MQTRQCTDLFIVLGLYYFEGGVGRGSGLFKFLNLLVAHFKLMEKKVKA